MARMTAETREKHYNMAMKDTKKIIMTVIDSIDSSNSIAFLHKLRAITSKPKSKVYFEQLASSLAIEMKAVISMLYYRVRDSTSKEVLNELRAFVE